MHTNSSKSDENIYKNTNAHLTQINGTAEEQGNENLTVEVTRIKIFHGIRRSAKNTGMKNYSKIRIKETDQ